MPTERKRDLREYLTAYEAREALPELSAWMTDDDMKLLPIWKGTRFETGEQYFDLDNPGRGPFVADGDEAPPKYHTYVARNEVPEQVWMKLITWGQPIDESQAQAMQGLADQLGVGLEQSAAGDARPLPRSDEA
jgi:hypothetical protein